MGWNLVNKTRQLNARSEISRTINIFTRVFLLILLSKAMYIQSPSFYVKLEYVAAVFQQVRVQPAHHQRRHTTESWQSVRLQAASCAT